MLRYKLILITIAGKKKAPTWKSGLYEHKKTHLFYHDHLARYAR